MVYVKMISAVTLTTILLLTITGCTNSKQRVGFLTEDIVSKSLDSLNREYCFTNIKDSLIGLNVIFLSKEHVVYSKIDKDYLLKDKSLKPLSEKIIEFSETTFFTDFYIMKHRSSEYLIMIGQAAGATGIGVDYWNYRCYSLNSDMVIPEFPSLVKTPLSFYVDDQNKLHYIMIEDSHPRSTHGSDEYLGYKSLKVSLYNEISKELTVEFHCKN